jgi:hypothetical protein
MGVPGIRGAGAQASAALAYSGKPVRSNRQVLTRARTSGSQGVLGRACKTRLKLTICSHLHRFLRDLETLLQLVSRQPAQMSSASRTGVSSLIL